MKKKDVDCEDDNTPNQARADEPEQFVNCISQKFPSQVISNLHELFRQVDRYIGGILDPAGLLDQEAVS